MLQINLHHSKAASAALAQVFLKEGIDLALIQEPWLHLGRVAGLGETRGKIIYCTSLKNVRSCILVRGNIQFLTLHQFCSRDLTTVELTWRAGGKVCKAIVGSVYLPYDSSDPPPSRELDLLVEETLAGGQQLILGCDANAHHSSGWGSSDTNQRGEFLLQYLVSKNLFICNVGDQPTFVTRNRSEVIDITVCTEGICRVVNDWHVSQEASLSDHRYIRFSIQSEADSPCYRSPRRADWLGYKSDLGSQMDSIGRRVSCFADIDQIASDLQDAMISCYHDNCPLRQSKGNTSTRWWSATLSQRRAKVRKLFNQCKRTCIWEPYHRALTEYSLAIKKAKANSWKKFTLEVNNLSAAARLQRVLSSKPIGLLGSLRVPGGAYTSGASGSLNLLLETHFPGCRFERCTAGGLHSSDDGPWPRASRDSWAIARKVVTLSKVKWAIKKFSPFKSPGGDGIFPAMIQHGPDALLLLLCELFRASLAYGYIPRPWRLSRVVFIPKRGKSDYSVPKSFRPISLSSFLLKTLERLVERHLRKGVLSDTPLHRNQHAYQPGKSCETALHQLVSRVEDSLAAKEIALCAFLDIEGAFDNVKYTAMVRGVQERGLEPALCRWIEVMLRSRRTRADFQGEAEVIIPTKGCPQGGVLSPLLWNLVVDEVLKELSSKGVFVQGYADDIVIMVQGRFTNIVANIMNDNLRFVNEWCIKEGLHVNPSKTVVVPFTRKKNLDSLSRLKLGASRLEISGSVKYLGITLDSKLTWNYHLDSVLHKAKWALMTSRRFVGLTWGIKPHIALWLYKAVVRPQVTYGSLVWWTKVNQTTVISKLESLQRLGSLLVTGAFRSSPSAALEVALNLLPLDIFIKAEARKAALRLRATDLWREGRSGTGHGSITKAVAQDTALDMVSDSMCKEVVFTKPFTVELCSREEWVSPGGPYADKETLIWYTDGSLIEGKSGYGVYSKFPKTELQACLGQFCTIFQAEIFGILACANLGLARRYFGKQIVILSDCQAALKALDSDEITSKLVWECFHALCRLSTRNNVRLGWVPGHVGIDGNESADKLAKAGANMPFFGPEPCCGISKATAHMSIICWAREQHRLRWRMFPGQTLGKRLLSGPSASFTKWLLGQSRSQVRRVIALITGHGHFRKHLHTLGILREDQECRLCNNSLETAEHIILDCERLGVRRRALFGLSQPGEETDASIGKKLLSLVEGTGIGLPT